MRILVTGDHKYEKEETIGGMLDAMCYEAGLYFQWEAELVVIDGGSTGADAIARRWAHDHFAIPLHETHSYLDHPVNPDDYRTQYEAVNEAMVASGADVCLAFKDNFDFTLETGMTEHCVKLAKAAGIPTYIVSMA